MTIPNRWKTACATVVFCVTTAINSPAQTFTTLFAFDYTNGAGPNGLAQGADGSLYGTTSLGGAHGWGTVFKAEPSELTTLYNFCSQNDGVFCSDGQSPYSPLVFDTDGNFYGTTCCGGSEGGGTFFEISPTGALTTLYDFCTENHCLEPQNPDESLVQGNDGDLYGTTSAGGVNWANCVSQYGCGTVFKISRRGIETTLYSFCSKYQGGICTDGQDPYGPLIQATDGNFYGTTREGGASNGGTVFKLSPSGTLTTLHSFCVHTPCVDGRLPESGVIQAIDGNLYGTTELGGVHSKGTVFSLTLEGQLTTIYSFCSPASCADGGYPGGLIQATDGNFYGSTETGAAHGAGAIFQITPGGTLTTLYNYCSRKQCADGQASIWPLIQATDGNFYGTNYYHGANSDGTIFRLSTGLGPFVAFVRSYAEVGRTGDILGLGLTGTTSVLLNATPASFTVVSDRLIRATIPEGGTSGYVTVATPSGTLTSNVPFRVIQ